MLTEEIEGSFLTREQTKRLVLELVKAASPRGISTEELEAALEEAETMAIHFGIFAAWVNGHVEMSWDSKNKELAFRNAER